jgi:hypothetical protein
MTAHVLHLILLLVMPAQMRALAQQFLFVEHMIPTSLHLTPDSFAVFSGGLLGSAATRYGQEITPGKRSV